MSNLNYNIMTKLFLFILIVAFFAMNVKAAVVDPVKPNAELRAELVQFIGAGCDFWDVTDNEFTAQILFTINSHNEIVVLSIDSKNPNAETHIANKLNYKKVKSNGYKQGVIYLLPIRMIEES